MEWITEAPNKPGLYWILLRGKVTHAKVSELNGRLVVWFRQGWFDFSDFPEITHWLGPIPKPKPPA